LINDFESMSPVKMFMRYSSWLAVSDVMAYTNFSVNAVVPVAIGPYSRKSVSVASSVRTRYSPPAGVSAGGEHGSVAHGAGSSGTYCRMRAVFESVTCANTCTRKARG
jgi:hypothetical protein